MRNESETREHILEVTDELLREMDDVASITMRSIAQRANVSVGLINYHFETRSNLLCISIHRRMKELFRSSTYEWVGRDESSPHQTQRFLHELYVIGEQHEHLFQFLLTHWNDIGEMEAALYLARLLKREYNLQKDEIELRMMALQILLPIQIASIRPRAFHHLTGIDLSNLQQRENYTGILVENLMKTYEISKETKRRKE